MEKSTPEGITNGEHKEFRDEIWEVRVQLARIGTEVRMGGLLAVGIFVAVVAQILGA